MAATGIKIAVVGTGYVVLLIRPPKASIGY